MTTTIVPRRAASLFPNGYVAYPVPAHQPAAVAVAPLLVALADRSDHGGRGDGATLLVAARLMAERLGWPSIMVSVRESARADRGGRTARRFPDADDDGGVRCADVRCADTERWEARRGIVRGPARRVFADEVSRPEDVAHETVAHETVAHETVATALARAAERHDARLLVMGASRHTTLDQLVGRETTLNVLRELDRPALVVAPAFDGLPRRVVVGTDFGPGALRAAREALALLADGGTLVLAHVVTRPDGRHGHANWRHERGSGAIGSLDDLAARLDPPAGVRVEPVVLAGDPAAALLAHARATGAGLIATGISGYLASQRMYVGGVATSILRHATCSVLVSPP